MKISELRKYIHNSLSKCLLDKNFKSLHPQTFQRFTPDVIEIFSIKFLDKHNAAYFNTNTASFSLNLGIYFNFEERTDFYPQEYHAHIRGCLTRNFYQKHPMDLKGFSLLHPERCRKDLWWVNRDGSNLKSVTVNAVKRINTKVDSWFIRYSTIEYVLKFLKTNYEQEPHKGGPFGFGSINSPARLNLIQQLENKYR